MFLNAVHAMIAWFMNFPVLILFPIEPARSGAGGTKRGGDGGA
ncbi:hypothetical protein SIAM614_00557 [Stappia aggregata IAM 12614]|uniref:Uncharacterized protein n=1 Tax=Roseibium aggregatum (strain ATCC 25650 / DSM 13394 / JCM 20685 / NBRC 16684 / NCIMB 2208 / IAM 12614 / B1) TaxID=384765 RepID=A0P2N4_ROSAI|nr:hypothetical protein SIAM614_00557 [Stappia aggregata IAM 12614] [Roseibium aggregatum IAM 12614]